MTKVLQELITAPVAEPPPFAIEREPIARGVALTVRGELDMLTVPELRDALEGAVESGVRRLLLDLRDVSFIDSVSVAAILNARRRLGASGRLAVAVAEDSYAVLIFEIAGLRSILEVCHSREEALARLRG